MKRSDQDFQIDKQKLPIGVFDSGVGGLTVMTVLKNVFPHENFVYIGDNANNPVGNKSPEEITDIAIKIGKYLEVLPIKMAVVACNTFTVVALEKLQQNFTYPLVGVCKGIHTAVDISPRKKIGVMATAATINSHKHKTFAQKLYPEAVIIEQSCPDFAHLIEEGHIMDDLIRHKVDEYLDPLLDEGVDTVILGCTHFPFIKRILESSTKNMIVYVDPAYETADEVKRILENQNLYNPQRETGKLELCFTKDVDMAAKLASCLIPPKDFTIRDIKL